MMPAMLLEEPTIMERAMPITVEQYHALFAQGLIPENTELLEGIIVEKMPKSPLHAYILLAIMKRLLKVIADGCHVRPEQPITCQRSEPEPDLAVVLGTEEEFVRAHPSTAELVIEIAISTVKIDRRKAAIYADAGVREYWMVLPETRQVEVHTKLTQSRYAVQRIFTEGQAAFSEVLPAFRVEVSTLFPR